MSIELVSLAVAWCAMALAVLTTRPAAEAQSSQPRSRK